MSQAIDSFDDRSLVGSTLDDVRSNWHVGGLVEKAGVDNYYGRRG